MHELGETRSRDRRNHRLQTPDTFVRTSLPCLSGGVAVVHAGPLFGCSFAQYTVEFGDSGGTLDSVPGLQRFVYVLEGSARFLTSALAESQLRPGSFAYAGPGEEHMLHGAPASRIVIVERAPASSGAHAPVIVGEEQGIAPAALMGDADLQVRALLPEVPGIDFAVNTMTYQPGASLPMVELHIMEHGLLMLEGGGIYRLGEFWYPVQAGDFLWMGPFCPQWFGALGKRPARYLIYKDWNRHPIAGAVTR